MSEEWANTALPRSLKGTKLSPPHPNILPHAPFKKKDREQEHFDKDGQAQVVLLLISVLEVPGE